METEKRILEDTLKVETREVGGKKTKVIVGSALKFNTRSQLLGWFVEQIDERALDETDMNDVVALFNHDNNIVLGRTLSGTLELEKREDGLYYVITPPNYASHVVEMVERGDVRGSSFQFSVAAGGSDWDTDPDTGVEVRTVKKIARLIDVSPVTFPAYLSTDTSVAKRSFEDHKKEIEEKDSEKRALEEEKEQAKLNVEADERERFLKLMNL